MTPQPRISVEAVPSIISEQQSAEFVFRVPSALSDQNVVRVKLSLGGDVREFVDSEALFNQFKTIFIAEEYSGDASQYNETSDDAKVLANGLFVDFAVNSTSARLTIPMKDDDIVERDGQVSVTILPKCELFN